MIYVILGMHKSGTTLVSQILHHSGINMGENIDPEITYDQGNKYERRSTLALNLEILGLDLQSPSFDLDVSPEMLELRGDQRRRMEELIRQYNEAYPDWGFKDPRTCLVYPLWASVLPVHKIIATYRPIAQIWPRFRHRPLHHYHQNPSLAWRLMKGWCRHYSNILSFLDDTSLDFVVLDYPEFMAGDADFNRLQEFVGMKLSDHRTESLYRNRSEEYPLVRILTWVMDKRTGGMASKIAERFSTLRQR